MGSEALGAINRAGGTITAVDGTTLTFTGIENFLTGDGWDGTSGVDYITSSGETDSQGTVLDAAQTSSLIYLWAGDDTITATPTASSDTVYGGLGNDSLIGGIGNDTLDGGAGSDRMEGGAGDGVHADDYLHAARGRWGKFTRIWLAVGWRTWRRKLEL